MRVLSYILIFASFAGCGPGEKKTADAMLSESLREGDIVFRRGSGMASRAVLAVGDGIYSHTGIVVADSAGWMVVHAVPGEPDFKGDADRVKMEPPETFFKPERAQKGAVMYVDDSLAAARAARRAVEIFRRGVLFDHDYNHDDSTKIYCTELIYMLYRHEGIDLVEGRISRINLPGFGGDYILPGDIQRSGHLKTRYEF